MLRVQSEAHLLNFQRAEARLAEPNRRCFEAQMAEQSHQTHEDEAKMTKDMEKLATIMIDALKRGRNPRKARSNNKHG